MRFTAGARLGHYDICAPLGAGGMGEVYRAKDSRLGREVAIKVLHEHLARDPDALRRFEQEARSVAALSHPNILAIHDFGSDGDVAFAITELLEGESLRSRLSQAPLPWRKSVEIGVAVAEGLAAAHLKGIIHRDLKPENLFLTSDGRVKILDFGLAQVHVGGATQDYCSSAAWGAVVGTTVYMSPEQVRGEPVHPASDLFALGCLLLEMIIGRRVFERSTAAETFAAILHYDPPSLFHT